MIIHFPAGKFATMLPRTAKLRLVSATIALSALLGAWGCRPAERPAPDPAEVARPPVPGDNGAEGYPLSAAERARAAFGAGLEAELEDHAEVALECYRQAVKLDPQEAVYHARLGQVLMEAGRGKEGAGHLQRAERLGVRAFPIYQSLAEYYLKAGRNDLAARQFEKMLACPELAARARAAEGPTLRLAFFLISHYSSAGRPADAARVGSFLVTRFPKRPEFRLERARHLLAADDQAEALKELAVFRKLLPRSSAAERMLALHYADQGRRPEALAQAELALKKLRDDPGAAGGDLAGMSYFRADLLGKLKRYAEARIELRGLLAGAGDDGERVEALVAMAYLDRAEGKSADAARRMQGAIASGIRSGRLYAALAGALVDLGRPGDAGRAYRRAQQLSPKDIGYRLDLARLLAREGKPVRAAAELRAALRIRPGDPECSSRLAGLYAQEGINLEEAAELVAVARRAAPGNGRYLGVEGWVRYRQGRIKQARRLLERAALRAREPEVFERLGDTCFALGLWRRARYAWSRALKLDPKLPGLRRKLGRIGVQPSRGRVRR